jgi:hypothetical protein
MNFSKSARYVAAICMSAAMFSGCSGGSPSGFGPTTSLQHGFSRGVHPDRGRSWMSPEAKTAKKLLYVSDSDTYDVYVFSFPKGKLVGTLTNQNNPAGLCTDSDGDVYVTQLYGGYDGRSDGGNIVEYAHGSTTPIIGLYDTGYEPGACSVDPKTGDVAVANIVSVYFGEGDLMIYGKGSDEGTAYQPPSSGDWFSVNTIGYDDQSNIFFAGSCNSAYCAGELPSGSSSAETLTLNEGPQGAGSVQWDGKYITLSDSYNGTIYRYTFKGTSGTEVSSTSLDGLGQWVQGSWIDGKTVTAPYSGGAMVSTYKYTAGGKATKTISGSPLESPFGVAISIAKKK